MRCNPEVVRLLGSNIIKAFMKKYGFEGREFMDVDGSRLVLMRYPYAIVISDDVADESVEVIVLDVKSKLQATANSLGWLAADLGWVDPKHFSLIDLSGYPIYEYLVRASPFKSYSLHRDMAYVEAFMEHSWDKGLSAYDLEVSRLLDDQKVAEISKWFI